MSEIKKAVVRATHKRKLSKPESETLSGRHILHAETFGEWVEETSRCRLVRALDVDRVMSIHYHWRIETVVRVLRRKFGIPQKISEKAFEGAATI